MPIHQAAMAALNNAEWCAAELKRETNTVGFSVKACFCRLDLDARDMSIVFDAQWLLRSQDSMASTGTITLAWDTIEEQQGLADWERAWRGSGFRPAERIRTIGSFTRLEKRLTVVIGPQAGIGQFLSDGLTMTIGRNHDCSDQTTEAARRSRPLDVTETST